MEVTNFGVTVQKSLTAPLMLISLYSPSGVYDAKFLANYAYINLNDQMTRVPGIGSVQVFGAGSTPCGSGSSPTSWRSWRSPSPRSSTRFSRRTP